MEIRIGLIGTGWMASAHTAAMQNAVLAFGPEPAIPVFEVVCGTAADKAKVAAEELDYRRWAGSWREVVSDPNIDVVDITTPNGTHAEIALAAIENGKHVYCEKPLSLSAEQSRRLAEAAKEAGVVSLVGYNYLKNPIQQLARKLVENGDLGAITMFRATFDQDVMTDTDYPFSWRMDRKVAGSGALGDMGSHAISLGLMLVGPVRRVVAMSKTFVAERPAATGAGYAAQASGGRRLVENDDLTQFICEFENGSLGHFSTSRIGTGRKLGLTYEIQGSKGALCFNQERMNELDFFRQDDIPELRGYKTIYSGPEQSGYKAFHPLPGVALSYNDQKTLEARALIEAVATGKPAFPDFSFAYQVDRIIEAAQMSAKRQTWVNLDEVK